MTKQTMFVVWFRLLGMCFPVWPSQAQVPKPAQCLISGIYSLNQLPETKDERSCWYNCFAKPDCHMAVVTKPLGGANLCLLVNCLKRGKYSFPRDPSAQINVYPKSTIDKEQWQLLKKGAFGLANERLRCSEPINHSSCHSGIPRFFYNSTSYRCERFFSGCGLSRNTFETLDGCEALCNEKFRCYRPCHLGGCSAQSSRFFYNVTSQRCESFVFRGCGSNGNIFTTVEECETLCADVKATTSQPAVDTVTTTNQPAADLVILYFLIPLAFLLVIVFVKRQYCRWSQRPAPVSDRRNLLSESDELAIVASSEES